MMNKYAWDILLMAEIRRAPLEVGRLSHYLQGFIPPNGGAVVQDFFPSTRIERSFD